MFDFVFDDVTHKKFATPNQKNFFRMQTRRLAASFEPLNSSLPLSASELCACKVTCDPVVLVQNSPKAAGRKSFNISCIGIFVSQDGIQHHVTTKHHDKQTDT